MSPIEWIALATCFATLLCAGVALFAVLSQMRKMNEQLTVQIFSDYTKRYQGVVLRLPEDINEPTFDYAGRSDGDAVMRCMRAYFDLCFEEWYLSERGWIDPGIWAIWHGGMGTALSKSAFRQAWQRIRLDTRFGKEFEDFLDDLIVSS